MTVNLPSPSPPHACSLPPPLPPLPPSRLQNRTDAASIVVHYKGDCFADEDDEVCSGSWI